MGNNRGYNSEGLSRRSILEALGSGGLVAGLQSVFTQQAAAGGGQITEPTNLTANMDEFDVDPLRVVTTLVDSTVSQIAQDFFDEVTDQYSTDPTEIADALTSLITDIPEPLEALEWLGENLSEIESVIANPPEDDDGNPLWRQSPPSTQSVSTAPVERVGSTVGGGVAQSGSAAPTSAGNGGIWGTVTSTVENHFDDVGEALEDSDVLEALEDQIPDFGEYFDPDDLEDAIKDPTIPIRNATDAVLEKIASPLDELEDIFGATQDDMLDAIEGEINITDKLNLPSGQNNLTVSVEPISSVVEEEINSNTNSVQAPQGFSTSQAPASGSGDARQNSSEDNQDDPKQSTPLGDLAYFGNSTGTVDRSETNVLDGNFQNQSGSDLIYPSHSSAICGALPQGVSYNAEPYWGEFSSAAKDGLAEVVEEYYTPEGDEDALPHTPELNAQMPCASAPGGQVAAIQTRITFGNAVEKFGGENVRYCGPEGASASGFVGLASDGCLYHGLNPTAISGSQYTNYLKDLLGVTFNFVLYLKAELNDKLEPAKPLIEDDFCSEIGEPAPDDDELTVGDLEEVINNIFDCAQAAIDEIQEEIDENLSFMELVGDGDIEGMLERLVNFEPVINDSDAPDRFKLTSENIEAWRSYAQCEIDTLKYELSRNESAIECDIDDLDGDFNGEESPYASLARVYSSVDDSTEIPTPMEVIGAGAQELTSASPEWSSVPLQMLCANSDEEQQIVDFLNSENVSDSQIPDNIQDHAESGLDIVEGAASSVVGGLIRHYFVQILEKICVKITNYAAIKDWGGVTYRGRTGRAFARVVEVLRYLEGTTLCRRLRCIEGQEDAVENEYGYPEVTPGAVYAGQQRLDQQGLELGGDNTLWGYVLIAILIIAGIIVTIKSGGLSVLLTKLSTGTGLGVLATEKAALGATVLPVGLAFASARSGNYMYGPLYQGENFDGTGGGCGSQIQ